MDPKKQPAAEVDGGGKHKEEADGLRVVGDEKEGTGEQEAANSSTKTGEAAVAVAVAVAAGHPCKVVRQLSVCQWRLNNSWVGTILGFGSNYYVTAVRAVLRTTRRTKAGETLNLIGLVVEGFGYRDLRAAHTTAVYRQGSDGSVTQLELVTFDYQASTATYKLCRLYFHERDFLPKHTYSFRYNGAVDYETTIFLSNLVSVDNLFANAEDSSSQVRLPPSDPSEWDESMTERVKANKKTGQWGNPDGPRAPYSPLGGF